MKMKLTFGNRAMSDSHSLGTDCFCTNISKSLCIFNEAYSDLRLFLGQGFDACCVEY